MTATCDILIVGGGVIGAGVAFHLARRGAGRVVLLEKSHLGAGVSGKAAGVVRQHDAHAPTAALARHSLRFYERFPDLVGGPVVFHRTGLVLIAPPEQRDDFAALNRTLHQGLGIDFPGAGVRLDMLEEAVQVCRAMFTGDDVSFSGSHYRLDHARNLPRPVQAGGPKIMIGGGGEKRTLRLVARYADMCNVTGDVSTLARKIGVLRRHCAEVGRDPAEVGVTWMTPLILTTSSQNTAEVHEMLAAAGSPEQTAGFTVGQPHEIPDLVAGHIEAGADEVIFSFAFADTAGITAVGQALGLGGR